MRAKSAKAKSPQGLRSVINAQKNCGVTSPHLRPSALRCQGVRRALAIERTKIRSGDRPTRARGRTRLIAHAYRMKGERGLFIKSCFRPVLGLGVCEHQSRGVFFEEQMILIRKPKGEESIRSHLAGTRQELRTHLGQRTVGISLRQIAPRATHLDVSSRLSKKRRHKQRSLSMYTRISSGTLCNDALREDAD